jgi:DNA-binding SARP family transcriptional activator
MEFRILGPLEVAEGGVPVALGAPKQRALLAVLLLHANEVVSAERLVDELWGEAPPARAAKLVQHYVSGLRKVLPAGVLLTRAPGYLLRVEPGQLDLFEFERLLEGAKRGAAEGEVAPAADLYRHALSLWRGPALEDAALEGHAAREAARLDDLRLAVVAERIELELQLGRHAELVGELELLAERHPYQERFRAQLMLALYRAGRQAEALEAYQATRRTLLDELGLEPSHELQRLERAILEQDPSLELPTEPRRPADVAEPVEPRRKTVTVLAAVLTTPQSDPEAFGRALAEEYAKLAAAAVYHGGRAERLAGGELIAVFGVPEAHEDDALRALRAAESVRGPEVRLGVASGEVLAEGSAVTGEPVAAAVRLAGEAASGEIVAAEATLTLGAGAVGVEGRRVVSVAAGRPAFPQRTEAPMVGRDAELERLRKVFAEVASERRCRVVTVFGEAGIGKSRLGRELVAAVGSEARVLVGRCVAYGEGATYLPLREALRNVDVDTALAAAEEGELVARRLAELTGEAEGSGTSGEGFWAVRQLLEALARERPLLLALDDVHWAEPTFLDLVEYLAEWSTEAPLLVLCLARHDLVDQRPAWGGPTSPISSIALQPLSTDDSRRLVAALAADVAEETRAKIAEAAEGNPLYAEQLAAYVEESGAEGLAAVPPTIEALLASRLDRLTAEERLTLERAAVVGREFTHGALVHLLPRAAAGAAGRHLLALARRGLVGPGRAPAPPGDAFRFHHVLIRDVAYAGLPKEARAELHERHADWLDQHDPDDALVGYHLEQAYRLRHELGPADGHSRRLALAAGERLSSAGRRAWRVGDANAGANLLGRASGLLPGGHPERANTLRELGSTMWAVGEGERADVALAEAVEAAKAAGDRGGELRARLDLVYRQLFSDPEGRADELLALASEAIPVFETLGDSRSLGWAWLATAHVHGGWQGRYGVAAGDLEHALAHYAAFGWVPSMCLRELAMALYYGPTPADVAIDRCSKLLDGADHLGTANVRTYLAGLQAMRGSLPEARLLASEARKTYQELAPTSVWTIWTPVAAEIERLADDRPEAVRILEDACTGLERLGDTGLLSERAGFLATVLCEEERWGDAEAWASVAEATAASDDGGAQVRWRAARARILTRRGALLEAEEVAQAAVRVAEGSDRLNSHADILLDLAHVLCSGGRDRDATRSAETALALYERKGNIPAARRTAELLRALAPA